MKNRHNYIFISIIVSIILIGNISLVRQQKEGSINENRAFEKFQHLTLSTFINGTYQQSLENALSDQFIGGETIKLKLKNVFKFLDYNKISMSVCQNRYVKLDASYYSFNCDDALIVKYETITNEIEENIKNILKVYNELNNYVDTYYYLISTPSVYNFEDNEYSIDLIKLFEANLSGEYKLDALEFNNYDEYINYFYKTDHHWNHVGTQKAYEDIISMMKPKDEFIRPIEEVEFSNTIFYGSLARVSQVFDFKENFKVYKYDYPPMRITNTSVDICYGNEKEYFKGDISKEKLANHYGIFYGDDCGEVVFDGSNSNENLLIIGNSYTNSINKLIASHFNKTYDVDLRHYERLATEGFDIKEYINDNEIDKVLIVMDYSFFKGQEFDIEWRN